MPLSNSERLKTSIDYRVGIVPFAHVEKCESQETFDPYRHRLAVYSGKEIERLERAQLAEQTNER